MPQPADIDMHGRQKRMALAAALTFQKLNVRFSYLMGVVFHQDYAAESVLPFSFYVSFGLNSIRP